MKRLTEKRDGSYVCINGEFHNVGEHINKLGQLEDIEEELGIGLITLYKAVTEGFWRKSSDIMFIEPYTFMIDIESYCLRNEETCIVYDFKDYGRTWALTKEELENDK